jgi:uncharacterized linocin/CFP29 family protein
VELDLLAIQEAGIGGPFALVMGTEPYKWLMAGDPNSYPLRERIQILVTGGNRWSPVLEGGAVLACRGGDFELTVGQDLTIGYKLHNAARSNFTLRSLSPSGSWIRQQPRT